MTAVRSFLRNRIAMLLVIVYMIMGFVVPSVIAEISSDLSVPDRDTKEIHMIHLCGIRDCILEVSGSEKLTAPVLSKSGAKLTAGFFSAAAGTLPNTELSAFSARRVPVFVPAVPAACGISSVLIQTIHLKDGLK